MIFSKFIFDRWQIAYRLHNDTFFQLLPNPKWGWAADPFPVMYQGELYIFAEVFLYKSERNGIIAYSKFKNGKFTDWIVSMDKHWHLSYPNVFTAGDKLYMCPESYQNEEIAIYELIAFPDHWEKKKVLLTNVQCVDTTFYSYQGEKYLFTFQPEKGGIKGKLYIYQFNGDKLSEGKVIAEDTGIQNKRPGGRIISEGRKAFRVSQNGSNGYGCGLVINEIDSFAPVYKEHEVGRVSAAEINGNWSRKFIGIHTYNKIHEIEVIDLKYRTFSIEEYRAKKRIQKVFVNKFK